MTTHPSTDQINEVLALPASNTQQRFWVLDQMKPGDTSMNVAVRFRLDGPLNVFALETALNEIIRRHEILRANFTILDGQVVQLVVPSRTIEIPVNDLRSWADSDRAAEGDRLAKEHAETPFDLASGPLLHAGVLRFAEMEHVLLINIHHIVSDGWSIGVITDELGTIYQSLCQGQLCPLAELPIQYADYTLWDKEHHNLVAATEGEAYWKKQLADLPPFEVMPDRMRDGAAAARGHILSRLLPVPLTNALRELGRQQGATLFATMLATVAALLHRYTGETDIVTGSQVVGRNCVEIEPLIGPFINTLVLRTDVNGDPPFIEILRRVRDMVSDALSHQDVPLDRVAELLRVSRSADRNTLFQINFIYQRDFVQPWEHAGLRMTPIPSVSPGALYDLNIFLVERSDGWRVSCEYNTHLFLEDTVRRLLGHFENLLQAIVTAPEQPISTHCFLSAAERDELLYGWNHSFADYPKHRAVHELFEQQAWRTPNAIAAVFHGTAVSYRELNERANQLARVLRQREIAMGSLIGICLNRSTEMLIAALAVWKAGCAYVPLDPSFPAARLSFMSHDSQMRLLISEKALATTADFSAPTLLIDMEASHIRLQERSNLAMSADPSQTAYAIYTSGSTGKPKGVLISQQALVNLLCAVVKSPGIQATDSLVAVTTLSFDIAALELFAPLLVGARVVIASKEEAQDGFHLRELLARSGATILQATPATWRILIDAGWSNTPKLKMLCGGEALTRELADSLLERGGELWNMYGPTETTIWSSWCQVHSDRSPISIGKPAANQFFYILDPKSQPQPVGVPGELYIGGDGVAIGYLNRAELTQERFLPNPFEHGRIYRTGDRARFRADGNVEMLGRMDAQVKVRGFRIELGEVEAVLNSCPDVRVAAVVLHKDSAGENALAGYFVPARENGAFVEQIRAHLRLRLPDYMVPTFLVPLPALPQTPNGKIDRKALPAPESVRVELSAAIEAPLDPLEITLIAIWEKVLGVPHIARTDNFFELGGHSLLAAKMFARMQRMLGKALPLATLFQAPTVAKLAELLRDKGWSPSWSSLVPIRPGGSKTPFYFVHPIGGNVLNLAGIATHFDPEQPIFGLQAKGLDGKETPNTSVEQMAKDYIEHIRSVQPDGPYHIGGFSAGGVVAYEMARQLHAAGQQVAVLALLDTKVDGPVENAKQASLQAVRRFVRTVGFNVRYAFHIGIGPFARQKVKNWRIRANIRLWSTQKALGQTTGNHLGVEEAFLFALRNYKPEPYQGNAILFRAKDELVSYPDPTLGWGGLVHGKLDIREVSGDHDSILYEPHIGTLARVLNSCLQTVHECLAQQQPKQGRTMKILQQSA